VFNSSLVAEGWSVITGRISFRHFVFAFQDVTFECVAADWTVAGIFGSGDPRALAVTVHDEALALMRRTAKKCWCLSAVPHQIIFAGQWLGDCVRVLSTALPTNSGDKSSGRKDACYVARNAILTSLSNE
jgi:hypothetical protein